MLCTLIHLMSYLVVIYFNVVIPDIFNDDKNVDASETNKLVKLVLFNND